MNSERGKIVRLMFIKVLTMAIEKRKNPNDLNKCHYYLTLLEYAKYYPYRILARVNQNVLG